MLRDTAVSLIAQRLGKRTDINDYIITEMQFVQEYLETQEFLPHFLLSEIASTNTTAGEERIAVPTDFLREYEEGTLWLFKSGEDPEWIPLIKRTLDEMKGAFSTNGEPQYYTIANGYFRLAPIPDDVYTIKMLYYQRDTSLDTNIENEWLKNVPALMIAMTGFQVATYIQNDRMIATFQTAVADATLHFQNAEEARRHANVNYKMEFK